MNNVSELEQLLLISRVQYDQKNQMLAQAIKEESQLRDELSRLAGMEQRSMAEHVEINGMRAIGADVLWQGWLGRAKTAINIKLARVLAIKELEQTMVRRAFGKVAALEELIKDEQKKARRQKATVSLTSAVEQSLRKDPLADQ